MAFFRNSAVNLLNLHFGIQAVVLSGGGAFFAIYLLRSGLGVPAVLVSVALILVARFVLRPLVVALAPRCGLRAMVIAGTLLGAVQYPFLAEVHGIGVTLVALITAASIGDIVYWTSYHAFFAALGDNHHRGHQVGVREAIAAIVGVASPLLTGWLLVTFGPRVAFGTSSVITLIAAVPLLWVPDVPVVRDVEGGFRAALPGLLLFVADGWIGVGFWFVWQIALFVSLGESYLAFGGALAFAALVGAVGSLTLGRHIDAGHGKRAIWYANGTLALVIVFRAIATGSPTLAVLANALGALAACLYVPSLMTPIYTLAKRSPCPLRFHVMTEAGWDTGGALGLLTTALLVSCGVPLAATILLSLLGLVALTLLLRRYYTARGATLAVAGG